VSTIARVRSDHYRIPLDVALTDSTHGAMHAFELVTARISDSDGVEGVGYTYTVGAGRDAWASRGACIRRFHPLCRRAARILGASH